MNHRIKTINQIKGLANYIFRKRGFLATSPLEAYAFFNLQDFAATADFQFHFSPIWISSDYGYDAYDLSSFPLTDGYTILPSLIKPRSRGHVSLVSSDPLDPPKIQPNFLSNESDLEDLIRGGKIALEVLQHKAFSKHHDFIAAPLRHQTDGDLKDHILKTVETIYHPVGTCKMGVDENAVVDPDLMVIGVDGLRIADASVMPTITSGNTNAPVIMIAEKAAAMILNK